MSAKRKSFLHCNLLLALISRKKHTSENFDVFQIKRSQKWVEKAKKETDKNRSRIQVAPPKNNIFTSGLRLSKLFLVESRFFYVFSVIYGVGFCKMCHLKHYPWPENNRVWIPISQELQMPPPLQQQPAQRLEEKRKVHGFCPVFAQKIIKP